MGISSVIVDQREPQWLKDLTFGTPLVAIAMLDAGDLMIATDSGDILLVERKTASDLLNTLRDDRLYPQVARMVETTPFSYLAICGQLLPGPEGKVIADGRETGWMWPSLQGALLTIQELGVHILYVTSDHDYEQSIIRLANRDRTEKRIKPARDATLITEGEIILSSFPGVGAERVQALKQHCGNVATAIQFLTDDTGTGDKVPGIGSGIIKQNRRALGLPDWAWLAVVPKEMIGEKA